MAIHEKRVLVVGVLLAATVWSSNVWACRVISSTVPEVEADAGLGDTQAPELNAVSVFDLQRGVGLQFVSCDGGAFYTGSSCDGMGRVTLEVSATDDQLASSALRYRLQVLSGVLPGDLVFPSGPVRLVHDRLVFTWDDEATDEQEPFQFELAVRAVDLAGNESDAVIVLIQSDGSSAKEVPACVARLEAALLEDPGEDPDVPARGPSTDTGATDPVVVASRGDSSEGTCAIRARSSVGASGSQSLGAAMLIAATTLLRCRSRARPQSGRGGKTIKVPTDYRHLGI